MSDDLPQLKLKKLRVPAAIVLILLGSYSLFRTAINYLIYEDILFWDSPVVNLVYDIFPKILFSILIIFLGVYLIVGKKKEMENEEDDFYQRDRSYFASDFLDEVEDRSLTDDVPESMEQHDEDAGFPESVLMQEEGQPVEEKEGGEV